MSNKDKIKNFNFELKTLIEKYKFKTEEIEQICPNCDCPLNTELLITIDGEQQEGHFHNEIKLLHLINF